jgi:tRNA(Ile2)-agmatinylcytidine synthase
MISTRWASMWLGLDDTDSLEGGCTTLVFHQLLNALPCEHGEPRLTRLWPFAAQRTRGNASLSVEIYADESIVAWLDNYWEDNIAPLKGKVSTSDHSDRMQYPSDPGMTLFYEKPDEKNYWRAVRGEASFIEGGHQWGGHGRIGAAASCAWPAENSTWEGIAWRKGIRKVSEEALTLVDEMPETFLCRDPRTKRGLVAPRGPCPVMFGVRATTLDAANIATEILLNGCEETIGSRVFRTNQATGDHLEGSITDDVRTKLLIKGGHVIINDRYLLFAESGEVSKTAQWLAVGDTFECLGLEYENQIHVEAIRVLKSVTKLRPLCECGSRMKSMGQGQGVRCPKCKAKSDIVWLNEIRLPPTMKWVQPPVDKRRHLAKSLTLDPKS